MNPEIQAVLDGDSEGCIVCGDCMEVMKDMPDGCVDAVVTDPPYGIGISQNPFRQRFDRQDWDSSPASGEAVSRLSTFPEAIIWGGNYFSLPPAQRVFVWDKMQPENFSSAMLEMAWTNLGGPAKLFRLSVTSYPKLHPTAKPVALMEWCIGYTKAAIILDPFCGSGTTCVAAKKLGRRYIGIEIDEKYCRISRNRLRNTERPLFGEALDG